MSRHAVDPWDGIFKHRLFSDRKSTSLDFTPPLTPVIIPDPLKREGLYFAESKEAMAYKFKPSKSVAKRFKVTKTGKLKHRHEKTSHLRSGRDANKKRHLGRPGVLAEGHARNMRRFMGVAKLKPAKTAHERALATKEAAAEAK
jgi:large subunit ribosomal protein L35